MTNKAIYLDSYTLQSDARIRIPKSAIENLQIMPGETRFNFYLDTENHELILKIAHTNEDTNDGRKD